MPKQSRKKKDKPKSLKVIWEVVKDEDAEDLIRQAIRLIFEDLGQHSPQDGGETTA